MLKEFYIFSPLQGEYKFICNCIWHVTLSLTPSPTFLAQSLMNYFKPPSKFKSLSHTFSCLCVFALTVRAKANNGITTKKIKCELNHSLHKGTYKSLYPSYNLPKPIWTHGVKHKRENMKLLYKEY